MVTQNDRLLVPILSAGNFAIGMGAFVVVGMLNPLAEELGLTVPEAGWIMTVYALAYAIGSPLLVSVTGMYSRRLILITGLALFGLAAVCSAVAPDAAWLFSARVIAAAGAGLYTPVAAAVGAEASAPESRGKALAGVFFGITLAQVFGIPAGSFIAYTFGWQVAFAIVAVLSAVCGVLVWKVVPRGLSFQATSLATLADTLVNWKAMLTVSYTASLMGAVWIVYAYLAPLMFKFMGYERDGLTLLLLVFGIGAVVGNILGGQLTDKVGARWTLGMVSLAQIGFLPVHSMLPINQGLLLIIVFIWSVCGWSFMAAQQTRLVVHFPEIQGVLLALNAAAIYIGASIGTFIGGVVIESVGIGSLGLAGGLAGVVALVHLSVSEKAVQSGARRVAA